VGVIILGDGDKTESLSAEGGKSGTSSSSSSIKFASGGAPVIEDASESFEQKTGVGATNVNSSAESAHGEDGVL
jgi:hypothetical protein